MFKYSDSNKRYHTLDYFYKHKFNSKVFKVSLNAGFTCPNRDGKVSTGGCIFCTSTGSGEHLKSNLDIKYETICKYLKHLRNAFIFNSCERYGLDKIDVLKVGHHGSKTSTSRNFLKEINPFSKCSDNDLLSSIIEA